MPSFTKRVTLIYAAKKVYNYRYIRIVTNGLLIDKLLDKEEFKLLDEISFSIDGPAPEIHDKLRGRDTFKIAISNLTRIIKKIIMLTSLLKLQST